MNIRIPQPGGMLSQSPPPIHHAGPDDLIPSLGPSSLLPPTPSQSQPEMDTLMLGKVALGMDYHTRHTDARGYGDGEYTDSNFAGGLVSSTISRDAAGGNAAREQSILSGMAEQTNAENTPNFNKKSKRKQKMGIPPPSGLGMPPGSLGVNTGYNSADLPPFPPVYPLIHSSASSPLGSESSALSIHDPSPTILPEDWEPTWPIVLRNPDQGNGAGVNARPEAAAGSHTTIYPGNETEVCEQLPNSSAQPGSNYPQDAANGESGPQVENQDVLSSVYAGKQEGKLDASTSQENVPSIAHMLAQMGNNTFDLDLSSNSNEAKFFCHLLDTIERMTMINYILRQRQYRHRRYNHHQDVHPTKPDAVEPLKPPIKTGIRIQVLHRIFCTSSTHNHHRAVFEDEPMEVSGKGPIGSHDTGLRKIRGEKPVRNLDDYLHSNPDISMVVFREHVCRKMAPIVDQPHGLELGNSARNERLLIVSQLLREAINELATCRPDTPEYTSLDVEMDAPYNFLYHHRKQIAEQLENGEEETREHIALLHNFLEHNYGKEYSEADEQFKNGIVNQKHLNKLFKPNQVIIHEAKGTPTARVLSGWPFRLDDDASKVYLNTWSWDFDGRRLTRSPITEILQLGGKRSIPITQLEFYPSAYASQDILQKLVDRGRKFWSMKEKYFACYSGWDAHHDQFFVSHSHHVHTI